MVLMIVAVAEEASTFQSKGEFLGQKLEDVVTPMTHSINHVEPQIIFGKLQKSTDPIGFFADVTLKFFEELSGVIM